MDVSYLLKKREWSEKALQDFGFVRRDGEHSLTSSLDDTGLTIVLAISPDTFTIQVLDPDLNEPYEPFEATAYMGGFVEMVRNRALEFAQNVVDHCSLSQEELARGVREWLFPSNLKYYDLVSVFKKTKYQTWHHRVDIRVGDYIYMYITAPSSAILYKCIVTAIGLKPDKQGRKRFQMKRLLTYPGDVFTVDVMRACGSGPVRSERSVSPALSEKLREYEEKTLSEK